jgi:amidohydrolase
MKRTNLLLLAVFAVCAWAQNSTASKEVEAVYPDAHTLYVDLHQNPELSAHETQTAAKLAARLRSLGYDVTEHVGGTGVVAILRNGGGPTVMLRTELDALPVEEKTGLPYASKVRTQDDAGRDVPVMHACGHDLHMASLVATAAIMGHSKDTWHGTLMLIGQPAEEAIGGAGAMIKDGLFTRFPKPDVAVALHVGNNLPAGEVGITPGIYNTSADSVRITIYGKGGHGASPHTTVDPIVIAARTILALQTIASREVKPGEMAVVTVGYIHAGTKNNIIPDDAELLLSVRTFDAAVRTRVLEAIERIVRAEAQASGAAREPLVEPTEFAPALINDAAAVDRTRGALAGVVGADRVIDPGPVAGSEDVGVLATAAGAPIAFWLLGGADPAAFAGASGRQDIARIVADLPSNHSPVYAPVEEPTIKIGVDALSAAAREWLAGAPHS